MLAGAIILPSCRRLSYDEQPASSKGLVDAEESKIINLSKLEDIINMNINLISSRIFTFQPYCGGTNIQLAKIEGIRNTSVNLKHIALQLCTCTWIEIMTGAGIILYMLYLGNYTLAAITMAVFAPLIGFHFAVSKVQQHSNVEWKSTRTVKLRP